MEMLQKETPSRLPTRAFYLLESEYPNDRTYILSWAIRSLDPESLLEFYWFAERYRTVFSRDEIALLDQLAHAVTAIYPQLSFFGPGQNPQYVYQDDHVANPELDLSGSRSLGRYEQPQAIQTDSFRPQYTKTTIRFNKPTQNNQAIQGDSMLKYKQGLGFYQDGGLGQSFGLDDPAAGGSLFPGGGDQGSGIDTIPTYPGESADTGGGGAGGGTGNTGIAGDIFKFLGTLGTEGAKLALAIKNGDTAAAQSAQKIQNDYNVQMVKLQQSGQMTTAQLQAAQTNALNMARLQAQALAQQGSGILGGTGSSSLLLVGLGLYLATRPKERTYNPRKRNRKRSKSRRRYR